MTLWPASATRRAACARCSSIATFLNARSLRCRAPLSFANAGDYDIDVTTDLDGVGFPASPAAAAAAYDHDDHYAGRRRDHAYWRISSPARATLHHADAPPIITRISPLYADPEGGTILTLHGVNFAPTPTLQCIMVSSSAIDATGGGSGGGMPPAVVVPAVFHSFDRATCEAPDSASAQASLCSEGSMWR